MSDEERMNALEEKVSTDAKYIDDLVRDVEALKRSGKELRAVIHTMASALQTIKVFVSMHPFANDTVGKAHMDFQEAMKSASLKTEAVQDLPKT